MTAEGNNINELADLDKLRSAPNLNKQQAKILLKELRDIIQKSDWLTIGVMSPTLKEGINAVRKIEKKFEYNEMKCITMPNCDGPIFLKANQINKKKRVSVKHILKNKKFLNKNINYTS